MAPTTTTLSTASTRTIQFGTGRAEAARQDRVRRPNLRAYYANRLQDIHPGQFEFRLLLLQRDLRRTTVLDRALIGLDWSEEGAQLTASAMLHRPDIDEPRSIPVRRNDPLRLLVKWGGRWYQLWQLIVDGEPELTRSTGDLAVSLTDELEALRRDNRDWEFRKAKHRPHGWRCHEIAMAVCRREGVRIRKLARGTVNIEKLEKKDASGLEVIKEAYARERKKTGRRYRIRFRNGALEILPFERPDLLYEIAGFATEEQLSGPPKKSRPRTVIEAKGRIDRGKKEKIELTVFRRAILRRFGRSTWEKDYGRVKSRADLREQAMRDLAEELRIERQVVLDIPLVPFIGRGDALLWHNREPGWHGSGFDTRDRRFCYVTAVTHSLGAAAVPTSSITAAQKDPYLADLRRLAARERGEKRKKRQGRRGQRAGGRQ